MQRTEELNKYLANKHKGGENNQKGGLYEDYYAVYQIVSCIAKYKHDLDAVAFQAQLKDTFVDDLLIAHPQKLVYHQLKNNKDVSWGSTSKKGDIAFDFAHQIEDCKEHDENFALKLVYSAKDMTLGDDMPDEIKQHSSVEWFPYQEDLNRLVLISDELKTALRAISPNSENTGDDVLVNIAIVFLGVWKGLNNKERISLLDIVTRVKAQKYVNLALYPDTNICDECKKILDVIDGLEYHVSGKMFYWHFGFLQGVCPWPDEMEERIVTCHPTTKQQLLALL